AFRLQREIGRAVSRQHHSGYHRNRNRVPVEQADVTADTKIREEGHREIAVGIERNSARNVSRGRAKKNGEQKVGKDEIEIPVSLPKSIVDVAADFERDTAQNQTPQNQKEGEIITCESRSHQPREDRDQCSAETD